MRQKRYMLLVSIFLLVLMILFAGISGMKNPGKTETIAKAGETQAQTEDVGRAGEIQTEDIRRTGETQTETEEIRNAGYEIQEMNPLTLDKETNVTKAVNQYLIDRAEQKDYIDYYKNVKVYMKDAPYVGTYIVFARYDMKIRGIYTEVPGLDTFYASEESDGNWKITENFETETKQEAVQAVSDHSDVKELVEQTQSEYETAVASDAILREALADLENALN